ncbi:MAG: hypothetical protein M3Y35_11560 [Actinomycetota bacterium]|nr:hypothetical protein [Actinomycetota bacterium]
MSDQRREPAYITEAKRAAARTGFIATIVIWFLVAALLAFDFARDSQRPGPYPSSVWIGLVALILWAAMLIRSGMKLHRTK